MRCYQPLATEGRRREEKKETIRSGGARVEKQTMFVGVELCKSENECGRASKLALECVVVVLILFLNDFFNSADSNSRVLKSFFFGCFVGKNHLLYDFCSDASFGVVRINDDAPTIAC